MIAAPALPNLEHWTVRKARDPQWCIEFRILADGEVWRRFDGAETWELTDKRASPLNDGQRARLRAKAKREGRL